MKTKHLTLFLFIGVTSLTINSCAFLDGKGSITTDNNILCLDYKNSNKSQLEAGLVHEMTKLYQNKARLNMDSIMAIRFDITTLKKFIYHIEMEGKKQNISSQDLGIRIYYARYPKKASWKPGAPFEKDLSGLLGNPITEQYELNHTLVMIPTIKKGSIHQDYNPFEIATYNLGLAKAIYGPMDNEGNINKRLIFGLVPKETDNLRQNHGEMYPPYSTVGMTFEQQ